MKTLPPWLEKKRDEYLYSIYKGAQITGASESFTSWQEGIARESFKHCAELLLENLVKVKEVLKSNEEYFRLGRCDCDPEVGLTCEDCCRNKENKKALEVLEGLGL